MLDDLNRQLFTMRTLWAAFLCTPAVFGAALFFAETTPDPDSPLPPILAAIALVEVGALFIIRKVQLGSLALIAPADLREGAVASEPELHLALEKATAKYRVGSIVSFAFVEQVVIMGFVASFLSGSNSWFLGGAMLAMPLLLLLMPTRGALMCLLTPPERNALRRAEA